MADNSTFITGTASGAFTEAFSDLPPWATEKTALQLEKYLRKSHDIQTKMFDALKKAAIGGGKGKQSPEDQKKINDELEKLGKNLKRNNEEDAKQRKRNKDKEKDDKEAHGNAKKGKKSTDLLHAALLDVAAIGTKVLGVNEDYIKVYDSLYQSGINVLNGNNSTADGFEALNQIVNLTGMRLQTLQKVVEKYSSTVNAVGLSKFAKTLAQANTQLVSLGYNSEAQAELLGTLVESESSYMDIRSKTSTQLAADAVRLGGQLTKLSQTVGISREQLQENIKANSKSIESAFVFAKYGAKAAETMNQNMAGIKDAGLKDMLMQLASAANPAQVEGYRKLTEAGLGDIAEQFHKIAKSGMTDDAEEFQKKFSSMTGYLQSQTGRMANLTNLLGSGGEEAARILQAAYQQGNIVSKAEASQTTNAQKTQASIAGLQTQIESLAASLQKAFFPMVEQVNLVTSGLKTLNGAIDGLIGSINAQTRSWIGVGLSIAGLIAAFIVGQKTLGKFFDALSGNRVATLGRAISGIGKGVEAVGTLFMRVGGFLLRFLGPIAALYAAFQMGQAIGEVLYNTLSQMGGFNDLMDSIFSGIESAGKAIVNGYEGLISAAATGIEWIAGKLDSAGKAIFAGFSLVGEYIKKAGEYLVSLFPWLKTVGEYVSGTVGFFKKIIDSVSLFTGALKDVIVDILKRFGHKMTFGLFEDTPEEKKVAQNPAGATNTSTDKKPEPAPVQAPPKTPVQVSAPKTPSASTVESPSAVPAAPPPAGKGDNSSTATAAAPSSAATAVANKSADINSLLVNQGLLLEQILTGTNALVSVNKDILKYARNAA